MQIYAQLESGQVHTRFCKRAQEIKGHVAGTLAMRQELQKTKDQLMAALHAIKEFKRSTD